MKQKTFVPLVLISLCCVAMLLVDGIWQPSYWVKSGIKIVLFLAVPLLYQTAVRDSSLRQVFRPSKQGLRRALGLGGAVYVLILGAYFLLRNHLDFSPILDNLPDGVTKATFPLVALYISFINSLLEEFFFRGFAFLSLRQRMRGASFFSAVAFALYHTAMMLGWFPPVVFALALGGLTVGGLLFNWLDKHDGTLYTGWLVHMFANFAINTVGMILFYQ